MSNINSPLSEANPDSLQDLLDTDPLKLSDQNIDEIVNMLRGYREQWQEADANKGKTQIEAPVSLSLSDLSL